jgi:hypothetical protein
MPSRLRQQHRAAAISGYAAPASSDKVAGGCALRTPPVRPEPSLTASAVVFRRSNQKTAS